MAYNEQKYSNEGYAAAAKRFRYGYAQSASDPALSDQPVLFEGLLTHETYSSGVSVCSSDLVSIRESAHEGTLTRSCTIAFNLGTEATITEIGCGDQLALAPGGAAAIMVGDELRMANTIAPGLRSRSLLIGLSPDDTQDDQLAETFHRLTSATRVTDLRATGRFQYLTSLLAAPAEDGIVGRLLSESRALEVLALALEEITNGENYQSAEHLHPRDVLALGRVRDAIHADPARAFTLASLATEAGMSVSSLKAKFPIAFGEPVIAYLRGIRLDYVRNRIAQDGWSLAMAAHFAGYRHQGNFSKAFKRRFGHSPSTKR